MLIEKEKGDGETDSDGENSTTKTFFCNGCSPGSFKPNKQSLINTKDEENTRACYVNNQQSKETKNKKKQLRCAAGSNKC